jgi:Na+-transporting methylmalonyl-CoA/oxaloacetate decarboxylase gamma subunit
MFLLLVLGVAIVVFLISLVIILHHRVTALIDLQLDRDRPKAQPS